MGLSSYLSCEAGSFSHHHNRFLQPEALRFYFPVTRTLGCIVCLAAQFFLQAYPHVDVVLPGLPAATLPCVLSASAAHLHPCYHLDECFFNPLVVGLPYSSIFCQFWLCCFLNWLLSFFWLYEEVKHIYLCLHLVWKPIF